MEDQFSPTASSETLNPRSFTPTIEPTFDFLSLLTGVRADGSSIYQTDETMEHFDDADITEETTPLTTQHKHRHHLFKRVKRKESNEENSTPHFSMLPTAPDEPAFGIYDNRDGQVFDAATRLRLHSLIATCLMNGISDHRVDALAHLLQWPSQVQAVVIAGTYGAPKKQDTGPTRRTTKAPADNTDTLRRSVWPLLGMCEAYDAIVEPIQPNAFLQTTAWNVSTINTLQPDSQHRQNHTAPTLSANMPTHIIILAVREAPNDNALAKISECFTHSQKTVCISSLATGMSAIAQALHAIMTALAVAPAVAHLPQIIRSDDVLPERALIGDMTAIETLYTNVYQTLMPNNPDDPTLATVDMFLRFGGALDQTAHELNVHPNTVRYRLRRAAQTTGWDATDPREAYVLRTAITLGRIRDAQYSTQSNKQ